MFPFAGKRVPLKSANFLWKLIHPCISPLASFSVGSFREVSPFNRSLPVPIFSLFSKHSHLPFLDSFFHLFAVDLASLMVRSGAKGRRPFLAAVVISVLRVLSSGFHRGCRQGLGRDQGTMASVRSCIFWWKSLTARRDAWGSL